MPGSSSLSDQYWQNQILFRSVALGSKNIFYSSVRGGGELWNTEHHDRIKPWENNSGKSCTCLKRWRKLKKPYRVKCCTNQILQKPEILLLMYFLTNEKTTDELGLRYTTRSNVRKWQTYGQLTCPHLPCPPPGYWEYERELIPGCSNEWWTHFIKY